MDDETADSPAFSDALEDSEGEFEAESPSSSLHGSTLPPDALRQFAGSPLDSPLGSPRTFSMTQHNILFSSPGATVTRVNRKLCFRQYLQCKTRFEALIKAAQPRFPAISDRVELLVEYIAMCKIFNEDKIIDRRIKALEADNLKLVSAPVVIAKRSDDPRRESQLLRSQLREAEDRIRKLQEVIEQPNDPIRMDPLEARRVEMGVRFGREKVAVDELQSSVENLRLKLEMLDRRLALMSQRKSELSTLFTENPDPALRVGDPIEELLKRFVE
jgi:hypothetical protein